MRKALSSVKPAWKELAYTRAARVPRARRARRWVRPPSGGQSPVAAAPDACAAAGTARRALRRPCLLIEVSPPERLPSASRAGKPRLALDYLSPLVIVLSARWIVRRLALPSVPSQRLAVA